MTKQKIEIDFEKQGDLVPAIVQEAGTGEILMLGYMNKEAFEASLEKNIVHFWSRSRNKLWMKGEESGNTLEIVSITADCDNDTLLVEVVLNGTAACHTGKKSCFFNKIKT